MQLQSLRPDLGEFLRAQGGKRRIAGAHDCATMPADWVMLNGWPDPMAAWRGQYRTEAEGLALIDRLGGLAVMYSDGIGAAGLSRRDSLPQVGDVGVLRILNQEAGAICTGKRWALVADRGLAFTSVEPASILSVWSVRG